MLFVSLSFVELFLYDLDRMNQDSLLAFFLNVFNCLYMHTLVVSDLVHDSNNKTKRLAFMRRVAYAIGPASSTYSLMDFKYGVLRAAMPFPEMKQKDRFMVRIETRFCFC